MPPGYLQMAGGYYMIESGSCGGGSFLNSLMGLTTAENQAFYGRLGPGLFGPEALSESYEYAIVRASSKERARRR